MCEQIALSADAPERLDVFVCARTTLTRSAVKRLIESGDVTVNKKCVKAGYALAVGDEVTVRIPPPAPLAAEAEDIPLAVVYEDADIAVIDKPQGMVVHPAPGHGSGTLVNGLLYRLEGLSGVGGALRPGIVHRIDRMTSGLIVVAKNDAAHTGLCTQFADHTAYRSYVAIVEGNCKDGSGTVDAPIDRHPTDRKRMAVARNGRGRRAVTHWRVVERMGSFTLVEAELETGRTHQIRVHMAAIGHPVAGDTVYGRAKPQLGLIGQALHGWRLTLTHPVSGERMTFYAPLPAYFTEALRRAGCQTDAETCMEQLRELPEIRKETHED